MKTLIRMCVLAWLAASIDLRAQAVSSAGSSPAGALPNEVPKTAGIYCLQDGKWSALPRVPVAAEKLSANDTAFELSLNQNEPVVCGHLHFKRDATVPEFDGQSVKLFVRPGNLMRDRTTGLDAIKVRRLPRSRDGNYELDEYEYPGKREAAVLLRTVPCELAGHSPDLATVTLSNLKAGDYAIFDQTLAAYVFSVHGQTGSTGTVSNDADEPDAQDIPALPGGYLWSNDHWVRLPLGILKLTRQKMGDMFMNGQLISYLVDVNYTCEREIPKVSGDHLWLGLQGAWKNVTDAVTVDDAHLQLVRVTQRNALNWGVGKQYLAPQRKVNLDFPNLFGLGSHKVTELVQEVEPELHTVEVLTRLKPGFYAIWTEGRHYLFQVTR